MKLSFSIIAGALALILPHFTSAYVVNNGTTCYLYPESTTHGGQPVDDTPSIMSAFDLCGVNGTVVFTQGPSFAINQVMNVSGLINCEIDIYAELIWSTNIPYWLSHSLSVEYQNLSAAWLIGGENITIRGYGQGLLNGNGQTWYDENANNSNQPGRPMAFVLWYATNVLVDGLSWTQTQFWHSFVAYSKNVTMSNIYQHSVSSNGNATVNTDGSDTWNSQDVTYLNWTVTNGDDCIAIKGNSTNVYGHNITCTGGDGMPIGSIGQYPDKPDYVSNILFDNVTIINANSAGWVKTWTGTFSDTTSNGDTGGGGTGLVTNVTWQNYIIQNVTEPIYITQCIYGFNESVCDTSTLQLENLNWFNFTGTSTFDVVSSMHCSAAVPCPGLKWDNVEIQSLNQSLGMNNTPPLIYQCANLVGQNATGANSTGIPCNRYAPGLFPQGIDHNY